VLSIDGGRLYELRIRRVTITGDGAVYGFVAAKPKIDPFPLA